MGAGGAFKISAPRFRPPIKMMRYRGGGKRTEGNARAARSVQRTGCHEGPTIHFDRPRAGTLAPSPHSFPGWAIRRNALDERDLVLDGHGISHHQRLPIVSAGADAIDRAASRFNPDEVVPQVVELLLTRAFPALPMATTQMTAAIPMDAQGRQDASHLVPE